MDYLAKPKQLPHNYFQNKHYFNAKEAFLTEAAKRCEGKEDVQVCLQKYTAAFDNVFNVLKDQLEKEDKLDFMYKSRSYYEEGANWEFENSKKLY